MKIDAEAEVAFGDKAGVMVSRFGGGSTRSPEVVEESLGGRFGFQGDQLVS
jgi:hypothetical protein